MAPLRRPGRLLGGPQIGRWQGLCTRYCSRLIHRLAPVWRRVPPVPGTSMAEPAHRRKSSVAGQAGGRGGLARALAPAGQNKAKIADSKAPTVNTICVSW
jgi:hypothetical protein